MKIKMYGYRSWRKGGRGVKELKYKWQTIAIKIHKAADRRVIYVHMHLCMLNTLTAGIAEQNG